jgi:molybdenum cofactor cytidylyltransferase
MSAPPCAAVVLAAGMGRRFGGQKLLARLEGRPILQHVLDAAAEAGLQPVVVVVGDDAGALEAAVAWRSETRVLNREPGRGLASSLQVGLTALGAVQPPPARALVLLGDQPRTSIEVIARLCAQPPEPGRPIIVPRYADGRAGNPVLLERAAWGLAASLSGDRGMSQLFAARGELISHVDVPGVNPDVDTPTDLERLSRGGGPGRSCRTAAGGRSRP